MGIDRRKLPIKPEKMRRFKLSQKEKDLSKEFSTYSDRFTRGESYSWEPIWSNADTGARINHVEVMRQQIVKNMGQLAENLPSMEDLNTQIKENMKKMGEYYVSPPELALVEKIDYLYKQCPDEGSPEPKSLAEEFRDLAAKKTFEVTRAVGGEQTQVRIAQIMDDGGLALLSNHGSCYEIRSDLDIDEVADFQDWLEEVYGYNE